MEKVKKIDHLKWIINRFDGFTASVNTKVTFIMTINLFIFGSVLLKHSEILSSADSKCLWNIIVVLLIIIMLGVVVSTIVAIQAISPFLKSGNAPRSEFESSESKYTTLLFFKSISDHFNNESYYNAIKGMDDDIAIKDLSLQASEIAKGLTNKFNYVKTGIIFQVFAVFLPVFVIGLLLVARNLRY